MSTENIRNASEDSFYNRLIRPAWECGKLAGQIVHQMQVLWLSGTGLRPDSTHPASAYLPWLELRSAIDRLIQTEHDSLDQVLNTLDSECTESFGSEWHHDLLWDVNQVLTEEYRLEAGTVDTCCSEILGYINLISDRLYTAVEQNFSSCQYQLFLLANHFSQLVYPVPAYHVMTSYEADNSIAENNFSWTQEGNASGSPWYLPTLPIINHNIDPEWQRMFFAKATRLRVSRNKLDQIFSGPFEDVVKLSGRLENCILDCFAGLTAGLSVNEATAAIMQPTYECLANIDREYERCLINLGLSDVGRERLDFYKIQLLFNQKSITREGYDIKPRIRLAVLKLLVHFLNLGNQSSNVDWFCTNWGAIGRRNICAESTVRRTVAELDSVLAPLNLGIPSGAYGYSLQSNEPAR